MFRRSCPIVILAAALAACLSPPASVAISGELYRFDPPISGQIVDYDTHRPMAGVVVSAVWFHDLLRFSEAPQTLRLRRSVSMPGDLRRAALDSGHSPGDGAG